jgi:hypothetical protein
MLADKAAMILRGGKADEVIRDRAAGLRIAPLRSQ